MPHFLHRIMDANLNRSREGLRVVEEIARLVLKNAPLQKRIKNLRHALTRLEKQSGLPLIQSRAALQDPGFKTQSRSENQRGELSDLLRANLRRVQEALRVLEEVSKLQFVQASVQFKRLRFQAYDLERDLVKKVLAFSHQHPFPRRRNNAS